MNRGAATIKEGFSLLEVLLVLAIVAIFAAVAASRYGRASGRYRADLAARCITADLNLARSWAKTRSQSRPVVFNLAGNGTQKTITLDPYTRKSDVQSRRPIAKVTSLLGRPAHIPSSSSRRKGDGQMQNDGRCIHG
jgi:prepilin-type N-terminal cleavage/methylation domain-containing protein